MDKASKLFAKKLDKIMSEPGFSVVELIQKSGVSRQGIYNFRRGEHPPNIDLAENIALALGYSLASFLGGDTDHSVDECMRRVSREWKRKRGR